MTQSDHVAGRFTGHFFARRFIFIDEGTFGGNRKEAGVLKTRITEDFVILEQKGIDAIMVRNRAMFMVASNSYSVVPADMGDRRWMVLDVGDGRIQDHDYFAAIHAELDAGGREAMLYDLLKRDISKGPNPRRILFTDARITQILVSEAPYIRMLHSLLDQGRLPQNWLTTPNVTTIRALLHELQTRYGDRHISDISLGKLLREIIPGLKSRVNGHYVVAFSNGDAIKERSTELIFPPLSETRQAFERRIGSPLNWSNNLLDWQPDPMNADQSANRDSDDLP